MNAANPLEMPQPAGNDARSFEPSMEEILASIRRIISDDQIVPKRSTPRDIPALRAETREAPPTADETPASVRMLHAEPPPASIPMPGISEFEEEHEGGGPGQLSSMSAHGTIAAPQYPSLDSIAHDSFDQESFDQESFDQESFDQESFARNSSAQGSFAQGSFAQDSFAHDRGASAASPVQPEAVVRGAEPSPIELATNLRSKPLLATTSVAGTGSGKADNSNADRASQQFDTPQAGNISPPSASAELFSARTNQAVASAFNVLAATRLADHSEELLDLARDMIRPLLRTWLDDNLPSMVERMVRAEIERVARGRR